MPVTDAFARLPESDRRRRLAFGELEREHAAATSEVVGLARLVAPLVEAGLSSELARIFRAAVEREAHAAAAKQAWVAS